MTMQKYLILCATIAKAGATELSEEPVHVIWEPVN